MIRFDKEGETPLDDISGLKIINISTRGGDYERLKRFMFL